MVADPERLTRSAVFRQRRVATAAKRLQRPVAHHDRKRGALVDLTAHLQAVIPDRNADGLAQRQGQIPKQEVRGDIFRSRSA